MNTAISISSNFKIANAIFQCSGIQNGGQWSIVANWTSGNETLQPGDIFTALFSSTDFDPTHILPTIELSSVQVTFTTNQSVNFTCESTIDWPKPFGIPVGFSIQNLNFSFQQLFSQNQQAPTIKLSGEVQVASSSINMAGYFSGASPVFLLIDSIPVLNLNQIAAQFLFTLPQNFIELSFSNSQIYYLATNASTRGLPRLLTAISPGTNISTQLNLELADITFPTIDINVNINQGISLTAAFEDSIDLTGFISLTGVNSSYANGPTLNINSQNNQSIFQLNCGFLFFNQEFGLAGVTITNDQSGNANLAATLSYPGTIGPFQNPALTMTYSKANGFQITNWPAFSLQDLLDAAQFAESLQTIYQQKSSCHALVNFALDQISTNFAISTQFVTQNPNIQNVLPGQFYLILSGSYTISASNTVVCSLPLPTLGISFSSPSEFDFNSIATTIGNTITNNADAVISQLFNNKAALAQFLFVFIGKNLLPSLASQLCEEDQTSLNKIIENAAGTGAGALGSLAAAASGLIAIGCTVASGANSSCGSPNVNPLDTPVINNSVLNGQNWTVNWNAVSNANYYEVQVTDVNGNNIGGVQYITEHSANIALSNLNTAPYTANVIAWANPGLNLNSTAGKIQLIQLSSVSTVNPIINYKTGILSCIFQSVNNAIGYVVTILDQNNNPLTQSNNYTAINSNQIEVDFSILNITPIPNFYKIKIIPNGGNSYISGAEYISAVTLLNWGIGFSEIGNTFNIN